MTRGFKYYTTASVVTLFMTVVLSCSTNEKAPKEILEKEVMVKAIEEILLTEEKVNRLHLSTDSGKKVFDVLRGKVFKKTGIPDSVFANSMNYYMDHPKELEQIYTALVDSLNLKEQKASVRPTTQ
jgi:hypothetical protein